MGTLSGEATLPFSVLAGPFESVGRAIVVTLAPALDVLVKVFM